MPTEAMTILCVHNSYQQPGGEDEVFRQEAELLEERGHRVIRLQAHNKEVEGKNVIELLSKTIFNREAYQRVRSLLRQGRPNLVHVHNTFPLLSPSIYYAAAEEGVPVIQTLHNYRLLCPSAVLFREGAICERCIQTHSLWPAIRHSCYRSSRAASSGAAAMLSIHRMLNTFKDKVSKYIALSAFARDKFVEGGLPADKLVVKPNFLHPDPGIGQGSGKYCMFVGRLTREKGVQTMLECWARYSPPFDLEIAGDGDMAPEVAEAAQHDPRVKWLGRLEKNELYQRMKGAAALIVPSTWYEPFGMVVIEAFATGLPVIASRIGALSSMIEHSRTGLHFTPGNPADLNAQLVWLAGHPWEAGQMRRAVRQEFEKHYTGERNYLLLMAIYQQSLADKLGGTSAHDETADPAKTAKQAFVQSAG